MATWTTGEPPVSDIDQVIRDWERSKTARANLRYTVLDERSFTWRLNHYADEYLVQERNQHRIRPRGRQHFSKHRHKISRIMSAATNIDLVPASSRANPDLDEIATTIVNGLAFDPAGHYKRTKRDVIQTGLASRAGACQWHVSYDGDGKPHLSSRMLDPLNVHWAAGFVDPDDPECPWVTIEDFPSVDSLKALKGKKGWTIPDDLKPDGVGPAAEGDGVTARSDIMTGTMQGAAAGLMVNYRKLDGVRVLYHWRRKDESRKNVPTGDYIALKGGEQYLACPSCGWKDKPSGKQPEEMGYCPECAKTGAQSVAMRVEREAVLESQIAYPRGRLIVVAAEQKLTFYDGPWPWKMRDINLLWFPCYRDPFAQWGISDTTIDRDEQCTINALTRKMYEGTMKSGAVIITNDSLFDATSLQPFEFNDEPVSIAISKGQGQPSVDIFKPDPITSGAVTLLRYLNNDFRVDSGTSDIGLQGADLKGVTATTASIAQQTGEVPVDDHIAQWQEREGVYLGVGFDIWRSVNEERVEIPVPRDGGRTEWVKVRGSDLDDYQFIVNSGPDFKNLDMERGRAAQMLMSLPPQERTWMAQAMGFPPSLLRQMERQQARMAAQMGANLTGTNGALAPPNGVPPPPPNGNGIPPALMQRMAGVGVPAA